MMTDPQGRMTARYLTALVFFVASAAFGAFGFFGFMAVGFALCFAWFDAAIDAEIEREDEGWR